MHVTARVGTKINIAPHIQHMFVHMHTDTQPRNKLLNTLMQTTHHVCAPA